MNNDIKIAIINMDGNIDKYYVDNNYHALLLHDYIQDNYSNDLDYKDISDSSSANVLAIFLREKGNIVFINNTTYKESELIRHGRFGIYVMPDEITKEQSEAIRQFNTSINYFNELQIWSDFTDKYECKMIYTKSKEQVSTIVEDYLEKKSNKSK